MPCGGIYSPHFSPIPYNPSDGAPCFHCTEPVQSGGLFVMEWDATIHYSCLPAFLHSEDGAVVIRHRHEILIEDPDAFSEGPLTIREVPGDAPASEEEVAWNDNEA